jgi:hypothetical protein
VRNTVEFKDSNIHLALSTPILNSKAIKIKLSLIGKVKEMSPYFWKFERNRDIRSEVMNGDAGFKLYVNFLNVLVKKKSF